MPIAINGSGTITGLSTGGLPDGSVDADTLADGAVTAAKKGSGSILQVKSSVKTDTDSTTTTTTPVAIDGLSVTITPTASTTKMILMANIGVSGTSTSDYAIFFHFAEGGTIISGAIGDASGTLREQCTSFNRVSDNVRGSGTTLLYEHDHNSSSALTYTIQFGMKASGGTAYVNRRGSNNDTANTPLTISTLTVMEVA